MTTLQRWTRASAPSRVRRIEVVAEEGRQVLGGYRGVVVVDGLAVYEVLARDGRS